MSPDSRFAGDEKYASECVTLWENIFSFSRAQDSRTGDVLSFGIIRCMNFKAVRVENCFPWLTFPCLRFLFRLAYSTTVSVVVSEDRNVAGRKLEWFYLSF